MSKNPNAVALGKMGEGKPKTMTPAAIQQRKAAGFKRKEKSCLQMGGDCPVCFPKRKKQVLCHGSASTENKVK